MSPFRSYLKEIRKNVGYFGAWPPHVPLKLGDVGILRKGCEFSPVTSLATLGIPWEEIAGSPGQVFEYSSAGSSVTCGTVGASASPELCALSGTAQVSFSSAHGLLFRAMGCVVHQVSERHALGEAISNLRAMKVWDSSWTVVIEVVKAHGLTVFVGGDKQSSLEIDVVGKSLYDLADPSAGLRIVREQGVATKLLAHATTSPLYKLGKLRLLRGFGEIGMGESQASNEVGPDGDLIEVHYDQLPD